MMVRNIMKREKHSSWRIVTFLIMILITAVVLILLNLNSRAKLIDFKYQFSSWVSRMGERLYMGKNIVESTPKYNTQSIPVLLYHGVGNNDSLYSVTKNDFRNQMVALKKAGFQTIDDTSFIKFMKGEITLPEKSFLLTFDDGQKSSYYNTDAILEKLGFQATMFIATGKSLSDEALFSEYYLNKNEIRRMVNSGRWNIGSHAVQAVSGLIPLDDKGTEGYFLSNRMWLKDKNRLETDQEYKERIDYELTKSKEQIKEITNKDEMLMSYPFSDYGENSVNAKNIAVDTIKKYVSKNYAYAFRQLFGGDKGFVGNNSLDNPYLLKRVEIRKDITTDKLIQTMESSTDLRLEPKTFNNKNFSEILPRWHPIWGNGFVFKDKILSIFVSKEDPSTLIILDGTKNWKDYKFGIQITSFLNNTIALYARSDEPEHSGVRCVWVNNLVSIEELDNEVVLSEDIFQSNAQVGQNVNLAISVKDNLVGCYENGELIAARQMKNVAPLGGVAIQFGASPLPTSNLLISSFSVDKSDLKNEDVYSLMSLKTKSLVQGVSAKTLEEYIKKSFTVSPRYASIQSVIPSDTSFYKSETYKDIIANFSNTDNSFTTSVLSSNNGTAYWKWPEIEVKEKQEYLVSATYTSTSPSLLMVKFTYADGSTSWSLLKDIQASSGEKSYEIVVSIPLNVTKMQVMQVSNSPGIVTVSSPKIFLLQDGQFNEGMVTLNFDDGRKTFIENAMPLLEKYKFPATVSVITSHTKYNDYMNPKDLKQADMKGNEIAAHTRDHFNFSPQTSYNQVIMQVVGSWFDLKEIGFNPTTFVYPYGSSTEEVVSIVKKRFLGARSTFRGFNTRNTDPYILKDQLVDKYVTKTQIETWLNQAKQDKSWLILEFHNIGDEEPNSNGEEISKDQLSSVLNSVFNSGLNVVTLSEGLTKLRQR
ncbi:MAG TPA: polysaccharide deacetylase family protein [Candidatus Paceibacterota bacterium]|nr:polysaccharide deacetylase family protein [Candidatus Paceibacterota bacterium]